MAGHEDIDPPGIQRKFLKYFAILLNCYNRAKIGETQALS